MKRKRANTLVALSSAAVLSVYSAGFMKTRAAAERLEHASRERPPVIPAPVMKMAAAPIAAAAAPAKLPPAATAGGPRARTRAESPRLERAETPKASETKAVEAPKKAADAAIVMAVTSSTPELPAAAPAPAPEPVVAPPPPSPAAPPVSPSAETIAGTMLRDGTYYGWGSSRHGDIQASVTILTGRITSVAIAQCRTRYSCDVIAHLPGVVLRDQTPEKINNVSGATQSVDAFYFAVVDAISKAK